MYQNMRAILSSAHIYEFSRKPLFWFLIVYSLGALGRRKPDYAVSTILEFVIYPAMH